MSAVSPDVATAGGVLTVDLNAIVENWQFLKKRCEPAECAAVVKADAYGLGLEAVVRALVDAGCTTFFVAHLFEAQQARALTKTAHIYVLNGLTPGSCSAYVALDARPVLGSREELAEWMTFETTSGHLHPYALHVDTGMNRLGLSSEDAIALGQTTVGGSSDLKARAPCLLMSHLAAAEDPSDPITAHQVATFQKVQAAFPGVPASLANSSGIFLKNPRVHFSLVRPGYALYGGNPTPNQLNPMRSVVTLKARIVQVRTVEAGERVGYNGVWTAKTPSRLAVLSMGYADGFHRAASSTTDEQAFGISSGEVIIGGRRCPIAGRISMDLTVADVTSALDPIQRGDWGTFIDETLPIDDVGQKLGTIGYEVLTGLGKRFERKYQNFSKSIR